MHDALNHCGSQGLSSVRGPLAGSRTQDLARTTPLKPVPHPSLDDERQTVLDEVDALLLRSIAETNSLTDAARQVGVSYRNAWDRIDRMESRSGRKVLTSKSGGAAGGSSRLTPEGLALLNEFKGIREYLFDALDDRISAENVGYKLSARNRIHARITAIETGGITSSIKMVAARPVALTSIISKEAVEDLGLKVGDDVEAVIKSTEVMIGKASPATRQSNGKAGGPDVRQWTRSKNKRQNRNKGH
jgi:molybdate transport system regulatory protein